MLDLIRKENEIIGLRLQGEDFLADPESGQVVVPKKFLFVFRLSEIPEELTIKPVEAIEGNVIHIEHNISVGAFRDESASVSVEDMGRRKLWDGEVGFSKFMDAMRQAIQERGAAIGDVEETGFEDDGDYIYICYEVRIAEDMPIEAAVGQVERVIAQLEERRDRILGRRTDSLLGICDKATFEIDLPYALEIAKATGRELALILVDIDYFKRINDSLGHQAGDNVLQGVAEILTRQARGRGEAYRWGGEELAMLLAGMGSIEARQVAEDIRKAVEQSNFEAGVRVTVSGGVASFPADGNTATALVKAADDALLRAKGAGRNTVMTTGT